MRSAEQYQHEYESFYEHYEQKEQSDMKYHMNNTMKN